jgi:hypothetical protein
MNDWISIKDAIPTHNQLVAFKSDNLWNAEGIFQDGKFVYSWVKGAMYGQVTHWIPLPKPPKTEGL